MTTKRLFFVTLCLTLASVFGVLQAQSSIYDTGSCGDSITYTMIKYEATGHITLHITGSGDMTDWQYSSPFGGGGSTSAAITSISISEGITSIGDNAFNGCINVPYIEIPSTVTRIGDYAFRYLPKITSINIPSGVTSIGKGAFSDTPLTSVDLPEVLTTIGRAAFSNTAITEITIPKNVEYIGDMAFGGCDSLVTVNYNAVNCSYMGQDYFHILSVFAGCPKFTTLNIGAEVETIPPYGFMYCPYITGVTFPKSLTNIGNNAFQECPLITEIIIPNNVKSIGNLAFNQCSSLAEVTLNEGLENIGANAFGGCHSLTEITIPESVKTIGAQAFLSCDSLKTVHYNAINVATLGLDSYGSPFSPTITTATIGNKVENIPNNLFQERRGLTTIDIPNSVKNIGNYAFYQCNGLTEITIGEGVESFGIANIDNLTGLKTVNFNAINCADSNNGFGTTVERANIGEKVTRIPSYLFAGSKLTEIILPESVKEIGVSAFRQNLYLTEVFIPAGIESIGDYAFYFCSGMNKITVLNPVPVDIESYVFYYVPSYTTCTLYVPTGSKAAYQAAPYWQNFKNIEELPCGCTDPYALNYNPEATEDEGCCIYKKIEGEISGCTNAASLNYNPVATIDDDSCIDEAGEEPIFGCTDPKSLSYNPLATDYDYEKPECQCVYANEENIFNTDIDETPVDTIGARAKESCDLSTGLGITSAVIKGITPTGGKNIIVHWEIVQNGNTIKYDVEYTVSQEGNNLFYLSVICKEGGSASQAKSLRSASEASISVTGYTVSAIYNVDLGAVGICSPKATSNLVVYPNPTKGKLIINNGQLTMDNVEIFDVFGKKQLSIINCQLSIKEIDISFLANGIYFLKIDNRMIKIIKN